MKNIDREQVLGNLSSRNLDNLVVEIANRDEITPTLFGKKMYTSRLGREIYRLISRSRGLQIPKVVPSYSVFENKAALDETMLQFARTDKLSARAAQEMAVGYSHIPHVNQLAISQLAPKTIDQLAKDNFGVWPVPSGLSFGDVDLDILNIDITSSQRALLVNATASDTREIRALWFKDQLVDGNGRPLKQDYLPTLAEALHSIELFFAQNGHFPDSKASWIQTRTHINVNGNNLYERTYGSYSPGEVLQHAIALKTDLANEIFEYINKPGSFDVITDDDVEIIKERGTFEVLDESGDTIFKKRGKHYLYGIDSDAFDYTLEANTLKVVDDVNEMRYEASAETVIYDIEAEKTCAREALSGDIAIPVGILVHRLKGVQLGVLASQQEFQTIKFADGFLELDLSDSLNDEIAANVAGLPVLHKSSWPYMFPDSLVSRLYDPNSKPKK